MTVTDLAWTLVHGALAAVLYAAASGPSLEERIIRFSASLVYILHVSRFPLTCALWLLEELDAEAG